MAKEQLCWTCQKACGDCSWSSCFQPVEGWTAEKYTARHTIRIE